MDKNILESESYILLITAFEEALDEIEGREDDIWYVISVLSEVRFKYLMRIVSDELFISYEYAIKILQENIKKNRDEVNDNKALVLISAMENLLAFSVCEQYQMMSDMPDDIYLDEFEETEAEKTFYKYNGVFASVENNVVEQAAIMAYVWNQFDSAEMLTYVTQRDERVRHSHQLLDGYTAPKDSFPSELIPPIDYNCRCFLASTGDSSVGFTASPTYYRERDSLREGVSPVFAESLATYGAIFAASHNYFKVRSEHSDMITDIMESVSDKFLSA